MTPPLPKKYPGCHLESTHQHINIVRALKACAEEMNKNKPHSRNYNNFEEFKKAIEWFYHRTDKIEIMIIEFEDMLGKILTNNQENTN